MGSGKASRDKNTRKRNLIIKPVVEELLLADGNTYQLAPLSVNMLVKLEEKFDMPASEILSNSKMVHLRYLIWLRMSKHHPKVTEEQAGELVTAEVLLAVRAALGA